MSRVKLILAQLTIKFNPLGDEAQTRRMLACKAQYFKKEGYALKCQVVCCDFMY